MKKRKFGRTNLHLSELCLNTTKLGWTTDDSSAFALLDTYFMCGGSFIQCLGFSANPAANPVFESSSEDLVGRWRKLRGIDRNRLALASRINFSRPAHGGSIAFVNLIRESCERSLRRLRTTHLDLLICEWDDVVIPMEEVLEAVDILVRGGLVRHAIAGSFPPWRVVDSIHHASARNHARFEGLQAEYSLMNRTSMETEALAMCREHGLGFLASEPIANGFLAQRPITIRELINLDRSWQNERFGSKVGYAVLNVLGEIADKRLATPAQIALAWVLRNSQVTSAIISTSDSRELRKLIRAVDIVLTAEETDALAKVAMGQDRCIEISHV
ncbi:MAG TPA: aldo/keto reductase [Opitutaceae bacterium]|nr:aldo/keto reductase [Opitutaceae bacterium]